MGYSSWGRQASDTTEATQAQMHAGIFSLQLKEAKGEGKKSFPKFLVSISNPQGFFSMTTQRR